LSEANQQRLRPEAQALLSQRLRKWEQRVSARAGLRRRHETTAALSFAQQRLWFLEQLEPGQPVYHVHSALRLCGRLRKGHLQSALDEIVRRHETLRTVFTTEDGVPIQQIHPPSGVPLKAARIAAAELRARMEAEAAQPFELGHDLMLRAALFELAPEEHVLQFTMHHIASDAWSLDLLVEECLKLYHEYSRGRTPVLPELPIQYCDFAVWQREAMQATELQRSLDYWKRKLAGVPDVLELPIEAGAPATPSNRGATRGILLDARLM
jgi:hypothetical protein